MEDIRIQPNRFSSSVNDPLRLSREKSIVSARLSGRTYQSIADEWGVTRQFVHQVFQRHQMKERKREQLAKLNQEGYN